MAGVGASRRKIGVGEQLAFEGGELSAEVVVRGDFGERTLRFTPVVDFYAASSAVDTFRFLPTSTGLTPPPTGSDIKTV